jgi:hypothetical protein
MTGYEVLSAIENAYSKIKGGEYHFNEWMDSGQNTIQTDLGLVELAQKEGKFVILKLGDRFYRAEGNSWGYYENWLDEVAPKHQITVVWEEV